MRSSSRNRPSALTLALFANAAALALIALALFARGGGAFPGFTASAFAQNQLPIGGGAGVFIVPAQFSATTYGCYIMDVDAQTVSAYQFMPGEKNLRLIAARTYQYDRRLKNYNTTPSPMEIKTLIDKEQTEVRGMEPRRQPANPEPAEPNK